MAKAAYLRVSSRGQSVDTQRAAVLRAAAARGDEIDRWYVETKSASTLERDALNELRGAARAGEIERVYVFKVDRLTRSGIRDMFAVVDELRRNGCSIHSVADGFQLDGPGGDIVLAVMASLAQMERQALGDRISAARLRIESSGGRWGRPRKLDRSEVTEAKRLRDQKVPIRRIAQILHVPKSTIADALSEKGVYSQASKTP